MPPLIFGINLLPLHISLPKVGHDIHLPLPPGILLPFDRLTILVPVDQIRLTRSLRVLFSPGKDARLEEVGDVRPALTKSVLLLLDDLSVLIVGPDIRPAGSLSGG